MEGQAVFGDDAAQPAAHLLGKRVEVRVCLAGEHVEQRGSGRGHRERVAVEGSLLRHQVDDLLESR